MMYSNIIFTVALIWTIAAVTPGPNFFITVHTAVGETRRLAFCTVFGIVAGTLVWAISAYLGVTILFKTVPMLYYSLKMIGGMYLIYIGFMLLVRKGIKDEVRRDKQSLSAMNCFRLGLLTNLLNPKTAAFMTSLFAATIPLNASVNLGISSVIIICLISAIWYSLVAIIFSLNMAKRAYMNYQKCIERIAGGIFILFGMKLASSEYDVF